jgi:putative transposase
MKQAFKYELFPSPEQASLINKTIGCSRFVWNWALGLKEQNKEDRKNDPTIEKLSDNQLSRMLTALKEDKDFLNDVPAQALVAELQHLRTAYSTFFRNVKQGQRKPGRNPYGYPKFKGRDQKQSYSQQQNIAKTQNRVRPHPSKKGFALLTLPKLRDCPFRLHRPLPVDGTIETVTVSRSPSGRYFCSILCTVPDAPEPVEVRTAVGVLRTATSLELSTGEQIPHRQSLEGLLKRVQVLNRRLSKKRKGNPDWANKKKEDWKPSKRYHKLKTQLAKLHERIANIRRDHQHKSTHTITDRFDLVCVDDTPIKEQMMQKRKSRTLADAGLHEISRQLEYKAKWRGKHFAKVQGSSPDEIKEAGLAQLVET